MKRSLLFICAFGLLSQSAFAAREIRCTAVVVEGGPKFSATAVLDINLLVQFKNTDATDLRDDHVAEVRFFGPQGFLYESRMVPLTSDTTKAGTAKALRGYRRPVKRQVVATGKSGKGLLEARVALPVAATSIVESSLYGYWRAEVYLDGSTQQCAEPAVFAIGR